MTSSSEAGQDFLLYNLRYANDTTLIAKTQRGTKNPLGEGEKGKGKSWLKTQH